MNTPLILALSWPAAILISLLIGSVYRLQPMSEFLRDVWGRPFDGTPETHRELIRWPTDWIVYGPAILMGIAWGVALHVGSSIRALRNPFRQRTHDEVCLRRFGEDCDC